MSVGTHTFCQAIERGQRGLRMGLSANTCQLAAIFIVQLTPTPSTKRCLRTRPYRRRSQARRHRRREQNASLEQQEAATYRQAPVDRRNHRQKTACIPPPPSSRSGPPVTGKRWCVSIHATQSPPPSTAIQGRQRSARNGALRGAAGRGWIWRSRKARGWQRLGRPGHGRPRRRRRRRGRGGGRGSERRRHESTRCRPHQ